MIKFYIQNHWENNEVRIYASQTNQYDNKRYALEIEKYDKGFLTVKRVELKEGTRYEGPPLFALSYELAKEMLPAIQEALDSAHIERPSESKLEGKLEATEKHLEDMRHLVFKI